MSSIRNNIILNGINTLSGIIFPVITFPYAARVLLPEGVGAIYFLNSIINYIVLLTSLGIPMYAVKEVAKYRANVELRDKVTVEIIILSTLLCFIGYIFVWLLAKFVPQIHEQSALFYILSLTIVFTALGVNWFYQGIEDFKFITTRALIIRFISAISLFLFVKDSSDLVIYGGIVVGSTVGNNIINFIYLKKHIIIKKLHFRELNIKRHIRPSVDVFVLNIIISLYIHLNSVMLGLISGDIEVGYFTAGTKISHIGLTIISSLSAVLLPRCSHLIKIGDLEGFNVVIRKSLNLILAISFPMTVGLIVLASPLTLVFCGEEYVDVIPILCLNAPVVVFISLTNLMGIQILYPKDKINLVIWSVVGGAIINILFNICLIPHYGAIGAAISTLIAEFSVLVIQMMLGKQYYPFKIKNVFSARYLFSSLIMGVSIYILILFCESNIMKLSVGVSAAIIIYSFFLYLIKDPLAIDIKNTVLSVSKIKSYDK